MPNLKPSLRWYRYEPDLPGNRRDPNRPAAEQPAPFYFEVAGDLTKVQFSELQHNLDKVDDFPAPPQDEDSEAQQRRELLEREERFKRTAAALQPYVRFGAEPLVWEGEKKIETLEQYLAAVSTFQSQSYIAELASAIARVNTLGSATGFFSERLSGGFTSTRSQRSA